VYQGKTGGEAMINSAAAEIARNVKTPHPVEILNRWFNVGVVPGGPLIKVAVTGREKLFVSTAIITACTARTSPTIMFHKRRLLSFFSIV